MGSIITIEKTSLNIAEVKCLERNDNTSVTVEFKERYTYLQNPESNEYERITHNDTIIFYFLEKEDCNKFIVKFNNLWQDYLDGKLNC